MGHASRAPGVAGRGERVLHPSGTDHTMHPTHAQGKRVTQQAHMHGQDASSVRATRTLTPTRKQSRGFRSTPANGRFLKHAHMRGFHSTPGSKRVQKQAYARAQDTPTTTIIIVAPTAPRHVVDHRQSSPRATHHFGTSTCAGRLRISCNVSTPMPAPLRVHPSRGTCW